MFTMGSPLARFGPWAAVATLAVVGLATVLVGVMNDDTGGYGGDLPSFYAAGTIVLNGEGANLYDAAVQQAAQSQQFPEGQFLYFAYPSYTAVLYAPLAALPYPAAFVIHTLLAIGALIGAVVAFRPLARGMLDGPTRLGIGVAVAALSYPLFRSILGGQNATFSLLLLALVARYDDADNAAGTGLAAAAMLYKPQFGLIVIAILIVRRRWQAVAWAGAGAIALFVIGVMASGGLWVSTWLVAVTAFSSENLEVNGHLMISVLGWIQNLLGVNGASYLLATLVILVLSVPILIGLIKGRWAELPWYAVAPLLVLAAPSALYYDSALALLTVGVALAWFTELRIVASIGFIAVSWTQVIAPSVGWSPLFVPVLIIALLLAVGSRGSDPRIPVTPAR